MAHSNGFQVIGIVGAPGRNRTYDPLLRRQLLYPLSYRRIKVFLETDIKYYIQLCFL